MELFKLGRACQPVYKYDLNSAYASMIRHLVSMNGEWTHVTTRTPGAYGIYALEHTSRGNDDVFRPRPFFYRDERSCIHYPLYVSGCYWSPEVDAAVDSGDQVHIFEGWEIHDDGTRPFDWVQETYDLRQVWKNAKPRVEAEKALKLLLASLYGKMSQRVGWQPGRRIPSCHQLEWAGYITSGARALLYRAIHQAYEKGGLIACETDSVITTVPLELPVSHRLGEWDSEVYDDCVYLQTGVYWLLDNRTWKPKYRGCDPDSLHVRTVLKYLDRVDFRKNSGPYQGRTTRFVGGKEALHTNPDRRLTWEIKRKFINVGKDGKRRHYPELCPQCQNGYLKPSEGMHSLAVDLTIADWSHPHAIPWRDIKGAVSWPLSTDPEYTL